jgi:hypothetical protein
MVQPVLLNALWSVMGLGVGGLIGLAFGTLQDWARRCNQARQLRGQLNNGWAVMPGSMRRVAYLLMALAVVQIVCPLLLTNSGQWWVTAGVVADYGWTLFRQLRQRRYRHR